MLIQSTGFSRHELGPQPIVTSPKGAGIMLDLGHTKVYELIASGELKSFKDGGGPKAARKILVSSIHDYVAKRIAAA